MISDRQRALLNSQLRDMDARSEQEFRDVMESAREVLPGETDDPQFEFIMRSLWKGLDGDKFESWGEWFSALPERFAAFKERIAFTAKVEDRGKISETGIVSLARLLVAVRRRERAIEGAK